jgi:hypothetical protein
MSLPWIGPGAAFEFVRGLTQDNFNSATKLGLTFDLVIEARAQGDNQIVAKSSIVQLAARFDAIDGIQVLLQNGASLNHIDHCGVFLSSIEMPFPLPPLDFTGNVFHSYLLMVFPFKILLISLNSSLARKDFLDLSFS